MILEEFDLKKQLSLEKKEGFEDGQELILTLTQKLIEASRFDDLKRATTDREYLFALLKEFNLTE